MRRWLAILGVPLLALGCSSIPEPAVPATGACSVAERSVIGAEYEAELAADCSGGNCPHFDEITARRDARRKEWLACPQ